MSEKQDRFAERYGGGRPGPIPELTEASAAIARFNDDFWPMFGITTVLIDAPGCRLKMVMTPGNGVALAGTVDGRFHWIASTTTPVWEGQLPVPESAVVVGF